MAKDPGGMPDNWVRAARKLRQHLDHEIADPRKAPAIRHTGRRVAMAVTASVVVVIAGSSLALVAIGANRSERKTDFRGKVCAIEPTACSGSGRQ